MPMIKKYKGSVTMTGPFIFDLSIEARVINALYYERHRTDV